MFHLSPDSINFLILNQKAFFFFFFHFCESSEFFAIEVWKAYSVAQILLSHVEIQNNS